MGVWYWGLGFGLWALGFGLGYCLDFSELTWPGTRHACRSILGSQEPKNDEPIGSFLEFHPTKYIVEK